MSILRWALVLLGTGLFLLAGAFFYVELAHRADVYTVERVPPAPLGIVFGAGLASAGEPSPVLAARVRTAVALYQAGKVTRVLLSGSTERHHDEIGAMRKVAQEAGLPPAAVVVDGAGLSTFDTCLRARDVYGATKVVLVTQRFHMPRALFVANALGLGATGVVTNPSAPLRASFVVRELLTRPLAIVLVLLQPHGPALASAPHRPNDEGGRGGR
jgi:SanA protein